MRTTTALLSLSVAACASSQAPSKPVQVPASLKPAANQMLARVVPAKGVQLYECRGGKWAFVGPEAELFDGAGKKIGRHYAGPYWEAADGSKVVAAVAQRADAPQPGAIPWLLLTARSVGKQGDFSRVTSIQRLSTSGGVAPSGSCSQEGVEEAVPYRADYYFFETR